MCKKLIFSSSKTLADLRYNSACLTVHQVTMSYVVPPIVMFLNKHPMVAKADLSSLTRLVCGAAPIGPEMVDEFHQKHPNCYVGQGLSSYRSKRGTIYQSEHSSSMLDIACYC